ncbi:prostatic acid phosphatase [Episyrphus balteatus]|uniref:prostatic acid phosphatase n=1 Tax=Episyrphus balteatus TaxID=286459 RepID=UPI002485B589|nr:prostatic acid phosphatase [Episyrphus balteatus]
MSLFFIALIMVLPFYCEGNQNVNDAKNPELKGKLVFAHILFRHGDRTPVEPYPSDPWSDVNDWPTGWGQLTNTGKRQHHALGQWLRKRYDSILNQTYSKDDIYIRATDVDRTLMSALSNLAGLYPPVGNDVWDNSISWQPIPIHTVPENQDNILAGKKSCPAYEYAYSAMKNSPEFQKYDEQYTYLYEYLTKWTGRTVDSLESVQRINNTLFIEGLYNKTLPDWTKKIYPSKDMTFISDFSFALFTYTRPMARLKTGPLIHEILKRFSDKASNKLKPNRSVWIYSAHDTTVANVLNTLKLFEYHSPPYAACVMLELRIDDQKKPYVSIFYKNTPDEPKPLEIPGCGTSCPLDRMYELYKDILPEDWTSECKLSMLSMTYEEANLGNAMGILVAVIVIILLLIYVASIYFRRRSYMDYRRYAQVA